MLAFLWPLPVRTQEVGSVGTPARAADERTTGSSITGVLLDPSGAAIAKGDVSLVGAKAEVLARTTTDKVGGFRIDNIAPGKYTLGFHADGFRDVHLAASVTNKRFSPLRVVLQISVETENVTVATGINVPLVSTETSENQNNNAIDRDALDRVPVFDQDYITTMSRFLDDNAIGTNGVSLVVNGIEANGPGVTPSAIQEVKINNNPYSARFSRPGRARLEIVTKSGTADYHGSMNFMFRDSVFDAANAFATSGKPPERRQYYEGSITGPIRHSKRTSFLLSLDEDLLDQQDIVDANAIAAAESLGFGPFPQTLPNPTHHFFGSGRIFHDLANGDQFWIGYSYEHRSAENQNVGGTTLPSAATDTRFLEHEINLSYLHQFSPHWLNQLRFLVGHFDSPVTSVNPEAQINISGLFTAGGAQADSRRTEYHFDGTDFATYASGKHQLSFGVDIPDISRRGLDDFTNRAGTYTFASADDYTAAIPTAATYLVQTGQGHVTFLERVLCAFVEDNIRVRPNFSVYLGVRYYFQNYFHDDPDNFAPRVSFAYAPSAKSKTVIRGGGGAFYDRTGPSPIGDLLHFNGVNLLRFIVETPHYPVLPSELSATPTSLVTLVPRSGMPFTLQYSIGIEQQVTAKSTFSAVYIGNRGIGSFRSIDANAPVNGNISRPNPAFGQVREIETEGSLKGNALELTFRGKPSKYFSGQIQYTLSRTDNNTSGITYFPASSYDPSADWGRSDNDRLHKFDLLASTQPTKYFTLGVALSAYSGKPVNITTGGDDNHDGILNDRPAGIPRNSMAGPGLLDLDLNLSHDFLLSKAKKEARVLSVALNSFNVLNHPNYVNYIGVQSSPLFGKPVAAQPPRRMQVDVQFKF
jgi:Carboxypeptidase regulatory-like domain